MNPNIIILVFILGVIAGYSIHDSRDKIDIHEEANKICQDYIYGQIEKYNIKEIQYNASNDIIMRIDFNE